MIISSSRSKTTRRFRIDLPVRYTGRGDAILQPICRLTSIMADIRSWTNLMKEDDWEACTKKNEFKRMIVGLLFFHANIQVRGNLVAWVRPYLKTIDVRFRAAFWKLLR